MSNIVDVVRASVADPGYSKAIELLDGRDPRPAFFLVKSESCGHCAAMRGEFEAFARAAAHLAEGAAVVRIDAEAAEGGRLRGAMAKASASVSGYPTMFIKVAGRRASRYDGGRTATEMLSALMSAYAYDKRRSAGGLPRTPGRETRIRVSGMASLGDLLSGSRDSDGRPSAPKILWVPGTRGSPSGSKDAWRRLRSSVGGDGPYDCVEVSPKGASEVRAGLGLGSPKGPMLVCVASPSLGGSVVSVARVSGGGDVLRAAAMFAMERGEGRSSRAVNPVLARGLGQGFAPATF